MRSQGFNSNNALVPQPIEQELANIRDIAKQSALLQKQARDQLGDLFDKHPEVRQQLMSISKSMGKIGYGYQSDVHAAGIAQTITRYFKKIGEN